MLLSAAMHVCTRTRWPRHTSKGLHACSCMFLAVHAEHVPRHLTHTQRLGMHTFLRGAPTVCAHATSPPPAPLAQLQTPSPKPQARIRDATAGALYTRIRVYPKSGSSERTFASLEGCCGRNRSIGASKSGGTGRNWTELTSCACLPAE